LPIKAIFFDMGGTIETYYHDPELRLRATPDLNRLLVHAGIDLGLGTQELHSLVATGLARYRRWSIESLTELPAEEVWREHILSGFPVDVRKLATAAEALTLFLETRYYRREMRPEMPHVLRAIRSMGLRMGVISNVISRGQVPGNLARYGIRHFFDPIVLSSVYGRRKPGPAIFHHAANRIGAPTSACAHVGDRIVRDILGARRAGYGLAIQIRHDFGEGRDDQGPAPDAIVDSMMELVAILEEARQHPKRDIRRTGDGGVRAILFDAGDLLYHRPNLGKRCAAFLADAGLSQPPNFEAEIQFQKTRAFRGEISQHAYRQALIRLCGIDDEDLFDRGMNVLEEEDNDVQFFPGVKDTLHALKKRGYLLGIVTDTAQPTHVKLRWFENAGIGHVWDAYVSSIDVGVRKPDPRIYRAALRQLGVQPGETIFVGHNASELAGAKSVGLETVAFNRDADAEADIEILPFPDLLQIPCLST